jgi:signal peptidase I
VPGATTLGSAPVWPAPPVPLHRHPSGLGEPAVELVTPVVTPAPVPWTSTSCQAVVAAVLVALVGLVFWAIVPSVAGFEGHVVVSGSMEPRLAPGDVVLTREVSPQQLQPGQVLLFPDPERPDRLLLHRLVSFDAEGDLVTRGDANQSNDSTPVPAASVIGQAQLRIPYVGLPAYWRVEGQWGHIGLVAVLLVAATVFATGGSWRDGSDGVVEVPRRTNPAPHIDAGPVVPAVPRATQRTRYRGGRRVGPSYPEFVSGNGRR